MIRIDQSEGRVVYKIGGRRIDDLRTELNRDGQRIGAGHSVVVLIASNPPLQEIWTVAKVAAEAQVTNLRFFQISRTTGMRYELKPMPVGPVTAEANAGASVLRIDRSGRRVSYEVDFEGAGDPLRALNDIHRHGGRNHPVVVLIDSRLPINEVWNAAGIAGKAQLDNLRFFAVFHENGTMSEIKRIPGVPLRTPIE